MDKIIRVGEYQTSELAKIYVNQVLESGQLNYGVFTKKLEDRLAKLNNRKYCIVVSSGTDALRISLNALKILNNWQSYHKVAIPSTTFVSTANVIYQNNMIPELVDVNIINFGMCYSNLRDLLNKDKNVVCVMPVHLCGKPCDIMEIEKYANEHNVKVICDSCETIGIECFGAPIGKYGDISCFSMYSAHILTTGVGGAILTDDDNVYELCRSFANHGRDISYFKNKECIDNRFKFNYIGYSSRITELDAAIGCAEIEDIENNIKKRRENAKYLTDYLLNFFTCVNSYKKARELLKFEFHLTCNYINAYMMYPIVITYPYRKYRNDLIHYLENNGIETRDLLPLLNQPCYEFNISDTMKYATSLDLLESAFYVGCHQFLDKEDMGYIGEKIGEFFVRYVI